MAAVRRHVAFYVNAHNTEIPHPAFSGQTPDEIYHGRGEDISERLEADRRKARKARLEANRVFSCSGCSGMKGATAS